MMSKIVKAHQEVRDLVLLFQGIPEQIPMQMKMTFCRQRQEAHEANASVKSIEDGLTDGWQMYPLTDGWQMYPLTDGWQMYPLTDGWQMYPLQLTVYQHTYRFNFLC
jgi:hypothetical protein